MTLFYPIYSSVWSLPGALGQRLTAPAFPPGHTAGPHFLVSLARRVAPGLSSVHLTGSMPPPSPAPDSLVCSGPRSLLSPGRAWNVAPLQAWNQADPQVGRREARSTVRGGSWALACRVSKKYMFIVFTPRAVCYSSSPTLTHTCAASGDGIHLTKWCPEGNSSF